MRIDFYGLVIETPQVTFHLWSPWRSSALEHRLFEGIHKLQGAKVEEDFDEIRVHLSDAKQWKPALQGLVRVLKGWQEETDPGRERRAWRWLLEGDTDDHGYDHAGEPAGLWVFVRLQLERGGPGETDKNEEVDLNGFGIRISPTKD